MPVVKQHALVKRFPVTEAQAREIVANCRIVHPYGDLGPLGKTDFGLELGPEFFGTGDQLREMAERLLTLSQSKAVRTEAIHDALSKARHAVFLGFAFHNTNVDLLTSKDARIADFRATAHSLTKNGRAAVLDRIRKISGQRQPRLNHFDLDQDHLVDCKCGPLINGEHLFLTG